MENEIMTAAAPAAPKRKRRRKSTGIPVTNEELLYQIADAGLLSKLHGVQAKTQPRTYYFDPDPEIKKLVDEFKPDASAGRT